MHKGINTTCDEGQTPIPVFVPDVADPITANEQGTYTHEGKNNFCTRNVVTQSYGFKPSQGKDARSDGVSEELAPTLSADQGGNAVPAVAFNIAPGKGEKKDDIHVTDAVVSKTLDASGSSPEIHQGGTAVAFPLDTQNMTPGHSHAVAFTQNQRDEVRLMDKAGALAAEPGAKQQTYVAYETGQGYWQEGETSGVLRAEGENRPSRPSNVVVAVRENQRAEVSEHNIADALLSGGGKPGNGYPAIRQDMAVRRLTPVECERLQGFPDNYTNIPGASDSGRYKALGNSMAVPVMAWIGRRIGAVHER
jgi:site-specific DNA-cytosine methylase